MSDSNNMTQQQSGRRTLVLLLLTFSLPIVIAYLAFINMNTGDVGETKNYGTLVEPATPLKDFSLKQLDDQPFTLEHLKSGWTLLFVGNAECDRECEHSLFRMRQAHMSQNEEIRRVQRVLLVAEGTPDERLRAIVQKQPGLIVVTGTQLEVAKLTAQLEENKEVTPLETKKVYLIDPLGNLMMQYPADFKTRGLIRDLRHLLKWSRIG